MKTGTDNTGHGQGKREQGSGGGVLPLVSNLQCGMMLCVQLYLSDIGLSSSSSLSPSPSPYPSPFLPIQPAMPRNCWCFVQSLPHPLGGWRYQRERSGQGGR